MSAIKDTSSFGLVVTHCCLQGVNTVLALATNSASLVIMYKSRLVQQSEMFVLASLSVACFLVGLTIPLHVYEDFYVGSDQLCLSITLDVVADIPMYHQMLHTLLIAIDRFVAVSFPLHYNSILSPGRLQIMLLITWAAPLMRFGSLVYLKTCDGGEVSLNQTTTEKPSTLQSTSFPNGIHFAEGICYITIVMTMIVLYGKIWYIAWQQHKRINVMESEGNNTHVYNIKATRTVTFILLVYVLTWMPVFILTIASMMGAGESTFLLVLVPFAFEIGLVNSWMNFFIYVRTNAAFSTEFKKRSCW